MLEYSLPNVIFYFPMACTVPTRKAVVFWRLVESCWRGQGAVGQRQQYQGTVGSTK